MEPKHPCFFLISPYSDITAPGVRIISAVLRRAGYRVRSMFLQDVTLLPENRYQPDFARRYPPKLLEQVGELAQGFDLAGISLMTNYFNHAVQLSNYLHQKLGIPVIWGGVHPTVQPEECLNYADAVCVGEGEETMLDVMGQLEHGSQLSGIRNLWTRGGQRPELRPLITDLDSLPFGDINFDDQFVLLPDGETIKPLTDEWFVHYASSRVMWDDDAMLYQILTSRGCPYGCTFCVNWFTRQLYRGQKVYRRRSSENVFRELEQAVERFPVDHFVFSDDSFFASSDQELEAFGREYMERIKVPFRCLATPNAVTERKVKALADAGLCYVEIGIQSCVPQTLAMFRRKWGGVEHVRRAAQIFNRYPDQIEVLYDVIIDNPWEPLEHTAQTLREIVELPRPYLLQLFSLTLFPGTELYERGISEGLVSDIHKEVYEKHYQSREFTYFSFVLSFIYRQYPRWILRLMLHKWMVAVFHRNYMKPIYKGVYEFARFVRTLQRRMLSRPQALPEHSGHEAV
jgi:anaerobic magnesium-protoporphyrin IX monomethyl ester cyclase